MEFYIAREMGIPVYVFLAKDEHVRDAPAEHELPETPELTALQRAHREVVQSTNHIYYEFAGKEELCRLVAQIPPVVAAGFRVDIDQIIRFAPAELVGRECELALLDEAWEQTRKHETSRPRVLTFVALGGEGKTSLIAKWLADMASRDWPGCEAVFAWSFYSQGSRDQHAASSNTLLTTRSFVCPSIGINRVSPSRKPPWIRVMSPIWSVSLSSLSPILLRLLPRLLRILTYM
ncbi:MAG: hypothetical protein SH809_04940 [Rhodothermales bacterium]|nr:hypothetical protein [Rhodothermales bacterium]